MSDVLEFSYRYRTWKLMLAVVVCLVVATGMAYVAFHNHSGLRFYKIITLPPGGATVLYWSVAALCAALAILTLAAIASGVTRRTYTLRLTPTTFAGPRSAVFPGEEIEIPFAEIERLNLQTYRQLRTLRVRSARGNVTVNSSDIGNRAFDELLATLQRRIQALHTV